MYVYLSPQGGFNDMLCNIHRTIDYCVKTNRTLLVDTTKSSYGINFSDYFYLKDIQISIITDVNIIRSIIADDSLSIYPNNITDRNIDNWTFTWTPRSIYTLNKTLLRLPVDSCKEDIIIHSVCGGGSGIVLFKQLFFKKHIIDHIKHQFEKLPSKYISIHVRNTDIKCDYKLLYNQNKDLIHSYNTVYIATDDSNSLDFFRSQGLNVVNFTEFPIVPTFNLHYSSISSDTKIKNMICDIYVICMSDRLLSNSQGGFIKLLRDIRNDISVFTNKIV
jgi:hypothetical protein